MKVIIVGGVAGGASCAARLVERHMGQHGVRIELNDAAACFKQTASGALEVVTKSGKVHPADIVILAIGVRPETELAKKAGLEIGQRAGTRVDEQMHTSDPDIFAVGDAVEVIDFVTGEWTLIPLAGPDRGGGARRSKLPLPRHPGRLGHRDLGATVAMTGANEKLLIQMGQKDFERVYIFPKYLRRPAVTFDARGKVIIGLLQTACLPPGPAGPG